MTAAASSAAVDTQAPVDFAKRFKGFVFDLDGTLADTFVDIQTAINLVRKDMGFGSLDYETVKDAVGYGARELVRSSLKNCPAYSEDKLVEEFRRYYRLHINEKTALYPGVVDTLDKFSGHPLAVLSNKPHDMTVDLIERLGIRDRFQIVRGQDEIFPAKPDPTCLLHIVQDVFAMQPEDVLMIGDFDTDVLTARNAGVPCAVVRTGMYTNVTQEPDWYINDIGELSR